MNELGALQSEENIFKWAKAILPVKNTLLEADASAIEDAFRSRLEQTGDALSATAEPLSKTLSNSQATSPHTQVDRKQAWRFPRSCGAEARAICFLFVNSPV
jgi:hypothetical protein